MHNIEKMTSLTVQRRLEFLLWRNIRPLFLLSSSRKQWRSILIFRRLWRKKMSLTLKTSWLTSVTFLGSRWFHYHRRAENMIKINFNLCNRMYGWMNSGQYFKTSSLFKKEARSVIKEEIFYPLISYNGSSKWWTQLFFWRSQLL